MTYWETRSTIQLDIICGESDLNVAISLSRSKISEDDKKASKVVLEKDKDKAAFIIDAEADGEDNLKSYLEGMIKPPTSTATTSSETKILAKLDALEIKIDANRKEVDDIKLSLIPKKKSVAFSDMTQAKWETIIDFTGIDFKEEVIHVSPDKLQQEAIQPFVWNPNLNKVDQMEPALQWLKTNFPLPASLETPLVSSICTEGYTRLCSCSSRDQTLSDSAVLGL
ncbi:hypothetical protein PPL_07234 [Heterostelium album PN500]|uniref:Uncharacterized protein n=1 Tax=Heterostelium pallidum (strain ATCC 26659 / Pp 5 / PN500) TaxID=670386 RepID=D3BER9_HETP5|nr:hypothetical protein PPL_07234 [Heterostelium album PN500]EFA80400.1 hypothetical protein PPL_07234 [Heterostelium album PN500]|eukprot:XP_020432520.1 hypothetical protein PPL_07234 [Heterostelium album PN500]